MEAITPARGAERESAPHFPMWVPQESQHEHPLLSSCFPYRADGQKTAVGFGLSSMCCHNLPQTPAYPAQWYQRPCLLGAASASTAHRQGLSLCLWQSWKTEQCWGCWSLISAVFIRSLQIILACVC